MTLYLSRVSLRRDPSVATLAPILFEAAGRHRSEASRRLIWTLFADSEARQRDFLWREDDGGRFYILSKRPPLDRHHLFEVESKPFAPVLAAGDRLELSLRANATIVRPRGDRRAGARDDVVMAALSSVPASERAGQRADVLRREGLAWLRRQGDAAGFSFEDGEIAVDGYEPLRIRGEGKSALRISVLEFDGVVAVSDPAALTAKIGQGFGRGKAFGLGLMLIRRAAS
jgi:CRISPR system Cascade subunit CasE